MCKAALLLLGPHQLLHDQVQMLDHQGVQILNPLGGTATHASQSTIAGRAFCAASLFPSTARKRKRCRYKNFKKKHVTGIKLVRYCYVCFQPAHTQRMDEMQFTSSKRMISALLSLCLCTHAFRVLL